MAAPTRHCREAVDYERKKCRGPKRPAAFAFAIVALLALQRRALRALRPLLHNGTGHLAPAVELELEEGSPGVLEAGLRARVERHLRIVARLHPQSVAVAAEGRGESGRRLVLTDIAVQDGRRERNPGCRCRVLR